MSAISGPKPAAVPKPKKKCENIIKNRLLEEAQKKKLAEIKKDENIRAFVTPNRSTR